MDVAVHWVVLVCLTALAGILSWIPKGLMLLRRKRKQSCRLPLENYKDGIVYIHMFPREFTKKCVNLSPFAIKLETWCRMKNVPYQAVETSSFSPKEGQMPWVVYNGRVMADSASILEFLKSTFDRYDDLTAEQMGVERSVSRMLDDGFSGLYFVYRYHTKREEFSKYFQVTTAPQLMRSYIAKQIGVGVFKRSQMNGYGRYGESHMIRMGESDLRALDNILGDKQFILGDTTTALDATVFCHLSQILYPDLDYPWKVFVLAECPRLLDYSNRIRKAYWPDWDSLVHQDTFR